MSGLGVPPSGGATLPDEPELLTLFELELRLVEADVDVLPFLFLNIANISQRLHECAKAWVLYR
jgi:hypothetical protein